MTDSQEPTARDVVATHITKADCGATRYLVAEVFPGVYVCDDFGGSVHSWLSAANLFEPLPEVDPERTFPIDEMSWEMAVDTDTSMRHFDAWVAQAEKNIHRD